LRVTLYTKERCGLCEQAADALRRAQKLIHFETEVVYIEDDPALCSRYHDRVPVIVVGDEEVASAPVEEARLLAVLSSLA
jgi:glutaredoxin